MADQPSDNSFLTASIDEYLISLASSLQQAAASLEASQAASQSNITYQLPKLEFELKMSLELTQTADSEANGSVGSSGGVLLAKPLSAETGSADSATAQAASTIKGTFIAVPREGGKPRPQLTVTPQNTQEGILTLAVSLTNAIGEPILGVAVETNIDRALTDELNAGVSLPSPTGETVEAIGSSGLPETIGKIEAILANAPVANTNSQGAISVPLATSWLTGGQYIAITIDAAGLTENLVYQKPNPVSSDGADDSDTDTGNS